MPIRDPWLPRDEHQPVMLLDFDGVINAICRRGQEPRGFERHTVWVKEESWPSHQWILPLTPGGQAIEIVLSGRHRVFVEGLIDTGIHVVWATTWQHAVLEPMHAVGFPSLPVLPIAELNKGLPRAHSAMQWKAQAIGAAYDESANVLFVDDSASTLESAQPGPHGGPFRVVVPRDRYGLTSRDMNQIRNWASARKR